MRVSRKESKNFNSDVLMKFPGNKTQKSSNKNNNNLLTITKINSPLEIEDPFVIPKSFIKTERKIVILKENQNKNLLSSFRTNKFQEMTSKQSLINNYSLSKSKNDGKKNDKKSPGSKVTIKNKKFKQENNQQDIVISTELVLPSITAKEDLNPPQNQENPSEPKIKTLNRTNSNRKRISKIKIHIQEQSVERYTNVRKNFKEKKLHIFNKSEKLFYVGFINLVCGSSRQFILSCEKLHEASSKLERVSIKCDITFQF
jgi:hypothetical protein